MSTGLIQRTCMLNTTVLVFSTNVCINVHVLSLEYI